VNEVHGTSEIEDLRSLEKERAELGEKQVEPLVYVDLRSVGLDLRKVRVEREISGEVRRHAVLEVDPALRVGIPGHELAGRGIDRAKLDCREDRKNLDIAAGGQLRHAFHHTHLGEKAGDGSRHRRPDNAFVLSTDRPRKLESPLVRNLAATLGIAQALEGDGHLDDEAVINRATSRFEQRVP
jgi:hypothetical protein